MTNLLNQPKRIYGLKTKTWRDILIILIFLAFIAYFGHGQARAEDNIPEGFDKRDVYVGLCEMKLVSKDLTILSKDIELHVARRAK